MTDTVETAAAEVAAPDPTPTPVPVKKPRAPRKPKTPAAPEPAPDKKPRAPRKPKVTPEAPVSETAPLVDFYGGARDGRTWQKLQRGPWPQAMDGETGEPVTPVRAVRLLAETPTGIYLHVERIDPETGKTIHFYVHSSIITAWRLMWGPA